jgi:MarR family transcriptional regulator, transcriptional regulator for hemolysin
MDKQLESILLYIIDQTSRIAKHYSQREFDLLGIEITVEQWIVMKVVEEKKGLSQNELAKETNRDPASITRTLDLLQKKGLIIREAIADNRRQHNIMLSKDGIVFVKQNMSLINDMRNVSIKGFSKDEVDSLISMLYRVQKNMR